MDTSWTDQDSILFRQLTLDEEVNAAATSAEVDRVAIRREHVLATTASGVVALERTVSYLETPAGRELALRQLEGAIQLIPLEQKTDYLAALLYSPLLVQKESDPIRFLRCENCDPWAAAASLVDYWSYRRKLFGDRAFRPLNLTGDGALDAESVALVRSGVNRVLPNDNYGRTVLQGDSSRRLVDVTPSARLQANFYLANVISENPRTQTDGFVVIFTCEGTPKVDRYFSLLYNLYTHFPLRTPLTHFCFCNTRWKQSLFLTSTQGHLRLGLMKLFQRNKVLVHVTDNRQEMLQKLLSFGLKKEGLPPCLGGTWTFEDHAHYVLARSSIDISLVSNPPPCELNDLGSARHMLLQDCRRQMDTAMSEISTYDKRAYTQALEIAPELVQKESCFEDFLMADDYHVANACRRLTAYWQLRRELFGQRAHRCLSQTGEGALSQADRRTLDTGLCMLLPDDLKGRPVVCVDTSVLPKDSSKPSIERSIFYILSVVSENRTAATDGVILLFHIGNQQVQVDIDLLRRMIFSLPIQVISVHLYGGQGPAASLRDLFNFGWLPRFHLTSAFCTLANELEPFGLVQSGLPVRVGGTWDISKFIEWQNLRISREWDLPLKESDVNNFPGLHPRVVTPPASDAEVKRRKEVMYSRRQRDRLRVEAGLLQEQALQLQDQQVQLRAEQSRLEGLVLKSELAVSVFNNFPGFNSFPGR